jgi:DNA polymerase elongation subunit (family B)
MQWMQLIKAEDPDIIIGYNIFGFDENFINDRLVDILTVRHSSQLESRRESLIKRDLSGYISYGRLSIKSYVREAQPGIIHKQISSSAMGDNILSYFNTPGRMQIDLLKIFQKDVSVKLASYKLDDVASHFISGSIKSISDGNECELTIDNGNQIELGNFIVITLSLTGQRLFDGAKLQILRINSDHTKIVVNRAVPMDCMKSQPMWGLAKDDITPADIFKFQKQGPAQRAIIAKYCLQDCALLIRLLQKRYILPQIFGMANVCIVPASYIVFRGQGIKIFSLVINECAARGYVLPVLHKIDAIASSATSEEERILVDIPNKWDKSYTASLDNGDGDADEDGDGDMQRGCTLKTDFNVINMTDDSYEGAIVLEPTPNIYTDPITIMDFGSLYPSEMIASNLSHDCICEDAYWLGDSGATHIRHLGYEFIDRSYDNFTWVDASNHNKGKRKDGTTTIRFIQYTDYVEYNGKRQLRKGIIPQILMKLLDARTRTKYEMEQEIDKNKAAILDGLQLAYKITANSLYGQIGARTSKIYKPAIAASTTAGGRDRIMHARDFVIRTFPGSEVIYGDTDSIFIKFNCGATGATRDTGDKVALIQHAIDMGRAAEAAIACELPLPHKLNYEKVFYPFILITKKRYIGIKYEKDPRKGKNTSMGVVTKRRDNAPIVKYAFTGVIDVIMRDHNVNSAIEFVAQTCRDIVDNKFDINMFVVTKTLGSYYKDPDTIAHRVLADRMGERDPGTKPAINERIPFLYINIEEMAGVKYLQGDRIEHVDYVRKHNCKLNYEFYITNQIMKPVSQIFELVVEQLPHFPYSADYFTRKEVEYYNAFDGDLDKVGRYIMNDKRRLVHKLIFQPLLQYAHNKSHGIVTIDNWFGPDGVADATTDADVGADDSSHTTVADASRNVEQRAKSPLVKMKQTHLTKWFS